MHLGPFAAFVPVVAGMGATLGRRLDGARIQNHRRGLAVASRGQAQEQPQVMGHGFKAARPQPALGLLVDRFPAGKSWGSMRHWAPVRTSQRSPL